MDNSPSGRFTPLTTGLPEDSEFDEGIWGWDDLLTFGGQTTEPSCHQSDPATQHNVEPRFSVQIPGKGKKRKWSEKAKDSPARISRTDISSSSKRKRGWFFGSAEKSSAFDSVSYSSDDFRDSEDDDLLFERERAESQRRREYAQRRQMSFDRAQARSEELSSLYQSNDYGVCHPFDVHPVKRRLREFWAMFVDKIRTIFCCCTRDNTIP